MGRQWIPVDPQKGNTSAFNPICLEKIPHKYVGQADIY